MQKAIAEAGKGGLYRCRFTANLFQKIKVQPAIQRAHNEDRDDRAGLRRVHAQPRAS
jgi:hypothetical protein